MNTHLEELRKLKKENEENNKRNQDIRGINEKIETFNDLNYENIHSTSVINYEINNGRLLSLPIKYLLFKTKSNPIIDSINNIKNIIISFEQESIKIDGELLYNIKPYLYSNTLIKGVYCLPLCLNTDSLFPSGSLSFSKNVSVKIELMSYSYTDTELHVDVIYYDQLTL